MHVVRCLAERDALLKARTLRRGRPDNSVRWAHVFPDFTDETKSTARHRPYELLLCAGVADRPPSGAYPAGERIVGYETPIPHRTDEFLFAHHAVPVPYEMDQHVEHLWLDVDDSARPVQLTPVTVDFAVSEYEGHVPDLQEPPDFLRQTSSVRSGHEATSRGIMRPWPRIGNPHVETCSEPPDVAQVSSV
jgi:hypothetical protein